jgi:hypothetical protein
MPTDPGTFVRRWRIHRERVVARIHAPVAQRVSLLVAPGGFGKSIALRAAFGTAGDAAFYRVPAETSTLLAFLRGLTNALEADVPGAHLSFAIAYERAIQSPSPASELARWLGEHLREAGTLRIVIDDLHNASARRSSRPCMQSPATRRPVHRSHTPIPPHSSASSAATTARAARPICAPLASVTTVQAESERRTESADCRTATGDHRREQTSGDDQRAIPPACRLGRRKARRSPQFEHAVYGLYLAPNLGLPLAHDLCIDQHHSAPPPRCRENRKYAKLSTPIL